jgi:hypothetical protein
VAVKVRQNDGPLEPITWPTGEEVAVRRPNIYASKFWTKTVAPAFAKNDSEAALDGMAQFVAMICPSKTVEQVMEECDENFLVLVCGYAREQLEAATEMVAGILGKSVAGMEAPASAPPTMSGTSPAESPAPTGVPCGT